LKWGQWDLNPAGKWVQLHFFDKGKYFKVEYQFFYFIIIDDFDSIQLDTLKWFPLITNYLMAVSFAFVKNGTHPIFSY
jgi:hypothetical protein